MRATHGMVLVCSYTPAVPSICECRCHGQGVYGACSIEGGCGHLHAEDRRCVSGPACVKRERANPDDGTRWLGALLVQPEGMCPACITSVGHTIGYLPYDVGELTALIAADGVSGGEIVSSSRELPVPIRLGVEALRAEIDFELQYWAEIVAAETDAEWDSAKIARYRQQDRVQRAADFLSLRVDTLVKIVPQERCAWTMDGEPMRDDAGDREVIELSGLDGALRMLELHRRVYSVAGRTKLVHRLTPACPWCDQRTLVRHNGSDVVECESCDKKIDEKHFRWFVAVLVREEARRQKEAAA